MESITGEIVWRIVNDKTKVKREIKSQGWGGLKEEKGETEDVLTCGAFGILGNQGNQRLDMVLFQTIGKEFKRLMKWEIKRERKRERGFEGGVAVAEGNLPTQATFLPVICF